MRQTLLLASIAIGQIYASTQPSQPTATAGWGDCAALPITPAVSPATPYDYLLTGASGQNFQVSLTGDPYAGKFLDVNLNTCTQVTAVINPATFTSCAAECTANIKGNVAGTNQACSFQWDGTAMACYSCASTTTPSFKLDDLPSPLPTGALKSTVMLPCAHCNDQDFGPTVTPTPSYKISNTVTSSKVIASLTQNYFFPPLSPAPTSNCAKTLPASTGYSCVWAPQPDSADVLPGVTCTGTPSATDITVGSAPLFQAKLTAGAGYDATKSTYFQGCYQCTHNPPTGGTAVSLSSKVTQVCNTQVVQATPASYTNALTYATTAQTVGTSITADFFGDQPMQDCTIAADSNGNNLKIVTTPVTNAEPLTTLSWTSSDAQEPFLATNVIVTCNDPCGTSYSTSKFTVTQNPNVCLPGSASKLLTGYTSLAIPVGISTNVVYNTANFFFDYTGANCNQAGLQLGTFAANTAGVTIDGNKNILSVLPTSSSWFTSATAGTNFQVTYTYWTSAAAPTMTQVSNAFTVTQDCTQAPFASTAEATPVSASFDDANPSVAKWTAVASVRALFLNANCWKTAATLPVCTVTNNTAMTTAVFTIAPTTTGDFVGLDYTVSVTNAVTLDKYWSQTFTVTCVMKGVKATSSSTTTAQNFIYSGCATTAKLSASSYATGSSTLSQYNTGSTAQKLFNIVSKTASDALFTVATGFCPDITCHLVGNTNKAIAMSFADNTVTSTSNSLTVAPVKPDYWQNVTAWCKSSSQTYYTIQKQQVIQKLFINKKTVATSLTAFTMQAQATAAPTPPTPNSVTITSDVLSTYFNFISPTGKNYYSCTPTIVTGVAGTVTLTPPSVTKAGVAQVLKVASKLDVGQDITFHITCSNPNNADDSASSATITFVQTCFSTVQPTALGEPTTFVAPATLVGTTKDYTFITMFKTPGACSGAAVPIITGCKATTAVDGITVADSGKITYKTTKAAVMDVTLMGCVDQNGSKLTGYKTQTFTVSCLTSQPSALTAGTISKSVTLKESVKFNLISTFYSSDAQCYEPSAVSCVSSAAPASLNGVSMTAAAPADITAKVASVGFSEQLKVTCTFQVVLKAGDAPVAKEVQSQEWTIAQNCNPVASTQATITSKAYAATSAATTLNTVGKYSLFITNPDASCYSGATTTAAAGGAAYSITPTNCVAAPPTAGVSDQTFQIGGVADEWLVKTKSDTVGGFNRTFALACTYPAAFIGGAEVIAPQTVTSQWTSFSETCITKVSPVGAKAVTYTDPLKVSITDFFGFGACAAPLGLSCKSNDTTVAGGTVSTIDGFFTKPAVNVAGFSKPVTVTCTYGSGYAISVVSNVGTFIQKECSGDVKSVTAPAKGASKVITIPYVYGSTQASQPITLSDFFTVPACITDVSTCTVASSNKTVGVKLTINTAKTVATLNYDQNVTSSYTTQVTLTCGGVTTLNVINVTQNIAGPCATVYAKTPYVAATQTYIQGKSSGPGLVGQVSSMFSGFDGCAKNEGCTLGKAATAAGFSLTDVTDSATGQNIKFVTQNWKAAGIKTDVYDISCSYNLMTVDAKKVPSKTVAVISTFKFGYSACTTAAQSSLQTQPTYTPQGGSATAFYKTPDYQSLFFANLNCPKVSGVSADPAPAGCDPTSIKVAEPVHGEATMFQTGVTPVKGATTLSLKNNVQGGYQAQLSLGACVPKGSTAKFASTAATTTYSQTCFQVLVAKPATTNIKLTRGSGKKALFATGPALLDAIFTGYDSSCNSIKSVTTSQAACGVTTTQPSATQQTISPAYSTSCALDTAAGYSGAVTVTVKQDNNPDFTSTFLVSLPAGASGGASSSKTTAVVLGVIGGVVGLGIIGGVAWYVIKGRGNGEVDPYDDDATTGLNQQEHA